MKHKVGDIIIGWHDKQMVSVIDRPIKGEKYRIDCILYSKSITILDVTCVKSGCQIVCVNMDDFVDELEYDSLKYNL